MRLSPVRYASYRGAVTWSVSLWRPFQPAESGEWPGTWDRCVDIYRERETLRESGGGASSGLVRRTRPEIRSTDISPDAFFSLVERGTAAMAQIEANAHRVMAGLAEKRHLERLYRFGIVPRLFRDFHCALAVPESIRGVKIVTPRFVAAAHTLGCPVYVWTVNDTSSYQRLVSLGVDGIYTDIVSTLAQTDIEESSS